MKAQMHTREEHHGSRRQKLERCSFSPTDAKDFQQSPKPRKRKKGVFPRAFKERARLSQHLDFGLLTSRTMRE